MTEYEHIERWLTVRQKEVLFALAYGGWSNARLALVLRIEVLTVKAHLYAIARELGGTRTRAACVAMAWRSGWMERQISIGRKVGIPWVEAVA